MTVNVSETEISAAETIGQVLIVESKQSKHRSVEVTHSVRVFDDPVTILVSLTVNEPWLEPTTGQPETEPIRVVITPISPLHKRGPTKLAGENYERLV